MYLNIEQKRRKTEWKQHTHNIKQEIERIEYNLDATQAHLVHLHYDYIEIWNLGQKGYPLAGHY